MLAIYILITLKVSRIFQCTYFLAPSANTILLFIEEVVVDTDPDRAVEVKQVPAPIMLLLTEHVTSDICALEPLPVIPGEFDVAMVAVILSLSFEDALSLL